MELLGISFVLNCCEKITETLGAQLIQFYKHTPVPLVPDPSEQKVWV